MTTLRTSHANTAVMTWNPDALLTIFTMKETVVPMLRQLIAESGERSYEWEPEMLKATIDSNLRVDFLRKESPVTQ